MLLMQRAGLKGLPGDRRRRPEHDTPTAADLVDRKFATAAPGKLWATGVTEHPTREGKVYCAVVLGLHRTGPGPGPGSPDGHDRRLLRQRSDRIVRGRMQTELLNRRRWRTRLESADAIFEYLEIFHNRQRRHSALGMFTPIEFELRAAPRSPGLQQSDSA
ncbi:IS3 family transposase [Streptomyces sp. TRM 70361]|uniref:IS3 family transposase n=1 Tax=Streptomyces sp. TRM 70361 TaxID=3116553 RepID=UPI002E7BCB6D|nr:IS3 family transposase [Streptomyces sp. TRM 70361]MEE1943135.1 IS3 family transposase [Streptomyces sp. TRM 70361]